MKLSLHLLLVFSLMACSDKQTTSEEITQTSFMRPISDAGLSRGVTVEQTQDGGYILTGYTTDGEYGGEDVLLIKTNSMGETTWRKTFGGAGKDNGWAVRQIDDGGYIIAGFTNSFGSGDMDIYLIRTDDKGEAIWTTTFGGKGEEFGWDVRTTKDNEFIIAAQTTSIGKGEIDAYLVKVDKDGKEAWSQPYGGAQIDRIFSVQQTPDGGYVAAGITYSFTSVSPDDRDGYLLKTDSLGKLEWEKTFGKDLYDVAHSIALTQDTGYIITGYGESFAIAGSRDVYLIKTDGKGQEQWVKTYGESGEERGIKGLQTKDGGYVAIGFTDKNRDMYLVRTDPSGDTLWTRTFGTAESVDFGYSVKEANDGGYIIVGHSASLDGEKSHILLIKTDREGRVIRQSR